MTPGLLLLLSCAACQPATRRDGTGVDGGDSAVGDGGHPESGLTDSGRSDSGPADSGLTDSGLTDSGLSDSGGADSGAAPARLLGDQSLDDVLILPGDLAAGFGASLASGGIGPGHMPALLVGAPDEGPGEVVLFDLDGAELAVLVGQTEGEAAGSSVRVADIDDDGFADLVVGARQSHVGGEGAGALYVIAGPVGGDDDLALLGQRFLGASGDSIGGALVVGDVDGDETSDLVVGAGRSGLGGAQAGAVFVLRQGAAARDCGDADCDVRDLADRVVDGIDGELAGTALALGDLDGDGIDDLLVGAFGASGAAGAAYALMGPLLGDRDLPADAERSVLGEASFDLLGYAVGAADVDGDGQAEMVVGVPGDDDFGPEAGRVLVFSGGGTGMRPDDAVGSIGGSDYAKLGWVLEAGEDIDGDGRADLFAGAPGYDGDTGAAYLIYGPVVGYRAVAPEHDARWTADTGGSLLGGALHLGSAGLLVGAERGGFAMLADPWVEPQ
ncbi:MAG: FG-GAP repeat protein [Alphaproteobacteria bacterium]|nr:FG-GAP repeat protein [Alphaproteobacteria bacterium]